MNFLRRLFGEEGSREKPSAKKLECAGCGRTESEILRDFDHLRERGVVIIGGGTPLLNCSNCNKDFCGQCQVDLGYYSGCPVCRKPLDD
jgi:hypothetical protein